ncbi:hypothetical protein ACFY71_22090 [Streptomyces cinerochromogenes]|uniref:Uncharacterized protein n=1 Tax=Streptomyces cinerochromogenes TaxID=66422 RepID=A0ABW7B3W8_9ACTN
MESSQNARHDHHDTVSPEGPTMHEFELHRMRTAELRREAQQHRLVREAVRARRAARRADAGHEAPAAESHTDRPRRLRLPRTA